ncbi:MAG: MerR family transcriptional regulator, partial [Pseudomonadota bacterium]
MAKARDAFRTISEVAETLDTPAHVLRFWESKFKQIKPVKRAGGRRYYRPDDLALLAAIKDLLHNQGNSIKDTQRIIRGGVSGAGAEVAKRSCWVSGAVAAGGIVGASRMASFACVSKMR